jgi:transcriptional regulator with XRE-family HTH domain
MEKLHSMNTKSSLVKELKNKSYRHAFVRSQVAIGLPLQCRALRESRVWTQPQLAEAAGMSQPRISEIERPGERKLNLETLFRLAEAFDVALQVRFVPFRDFVDYVDDVRLGSFYIKPFDKDVADLEQEEIWEKAKKALAAGSQENDRERAPDEEEGTPEKENPLNPNKGRLHSMPPLQGMGGVLWGGGDQESRLGAL